MEEVYIIAVLLAFAATTTAFLMLYQKILRETNSIPTISLEEIVDDESVKRLREILSERRKDDLRKLLSELKKVESDVERVVNYERSNEGEGGGDS